MARAHSVRPLNNHHFYGIYFIHIHIDQITKMRCLCLYGWTKNITVDAVTVVAAATAAATPTQDETKMTTHKTRLCFVLCVETSIHHQQKKE